MKTFLKNLFEYNEIINRQMFEVLIHNELKLPKRVIDLAAHILLVHDSWNKRMHGNEGLKNFWVMLPIENWQLINKNLNEESKSIIEDQNLDEQFSYKNTAGKAFYNSYTDGLFHIINHSNYHRGQINQLLREASIDPIITDYIFYKR